MIRYVTISLAAVIALIGAWISYLNFAEAQQAHAYYATREILRAVHDSKKDLRLSVDASRDAKAIRIARHKAFFDKLPAGTHRDDVYHRLATEGMSCVPESAENKAEAQCMATGHSEDFRWFFVLHFGNDGKLADAEIRTLKGG
jgi:hypothetical protein